MEALLRFQCYLRILLSNGVTEPFEVKLRNLRQLLVHMSYSFWLIECFVSAASVSRILFPSPTILTSVLLVPYFAQTIKSQDTPLDFRYIVGMRRISDCCQSLEDMLCFRPDHMRCLLITCCISRESDGGDSSQAACSFIFVSSGSETCQSLGKVLQRIIEFPLCCFQFAT